MIRRALVLVVACALAAAADPARPPVLRGVGVDEHVGMKLPLDLTFTETAGRRITLGSLFDDRKPVLLVLAYVRCKMLCSLVLQATTQAVEQMPLELGRDYRLITVSIDPGEDATSARMKREELVARAGYPHAPERWNYLVGAERPIRRLAEALGFRYAWDPRTEQYAHPAVVFVLTPAGTISRYLHGVQLDPAAVANALRAAARDELSTDSIAEAVLACFRFDPAARAHRDRIERYLRIGGATVCLILGGTVCGLIVWDRRRRRRS